VLRTRVVGVTSPLHSLTQVNWCNRLFTTSIWTFDFDIA
jgi:hypothetical protein